MFRQLLAVGILGWAHGSLCSIAAPTAVDSGLNITYYGLNQNGIETFLNIPYGQDTGGANRFKPPRPHIPLRGSTIQATSYGPACPQPLGELGFPIVLTNVTTISEDCLNLNIARPKGIGPRDKLPVMVFIHGGGFWFGQNKEITTAPDGLVLESIHNGLPVIHVAMNYRLGFFGFAQSDALRAEGSENAGLRDQRLAFEWVQKNIHYFGGDPDKVTIFGQSSGGLAVGLHIMAYGGTKPVPFRQGICESQALEPGITGNFTIDAMKAVADYLGCNSTDLNSAATIACLRKLEMNTVLNASVQTYQTDIVHNIGDIWLPVVDGDFLPAPPSQLLREKRFANVTTMIGWCQDDLNFFTDFTIRTANDTLNFISSYIPNVDVKNIGQLLSLYPVSDFQANQPANLAAEFYRAARIFRDILMTCSPIGFGESMASAGNDVYFYNWNQTILDPILAKEINQSGLGTIHTSEFAYIFGNISNYNATGFPLNPTLEDYALQRRASRSWSTFASTGKPGLKGHDTFQQFTPAFSGHNQTFIFVAGGPHEGSWAIDGRDSQPGITEQKLAQRCSYINSPEIIMQLQY